MGNSLRGPSSMLEQRSQLSNFSAIYIDISLALKQFMCVNVMCVCESYEHRGTKKLHLS